MKKITIIASLLVAGILASCGKENVGSGRELIGTWVDVNHTSDTLLFFNKGGRVILFDNSLTYRTIRANGGVISPSTNQYEVMLSDEELSTRMLGINLPGLEGFQSGKFEWITRNQEFSVEPHGFRLYLSCTGCPQQFRKIN